MMKTGTRILVIGSGSIGRRHLRNIHSLGYKTLAICDTDAERMTPLTEEIDSLTPYTDYTQGLADFSPDIVFICTPPVFHVPQALQAVEANAHVFIEKPLSNTLHDTDTLLEAVEKHQRVVHVGYNLRFHPGLQTVKHLLTESEIGQPLWSRLEIGQYLPDWRPWQDYRQSYTARKELGGGIILDASHEIDYALWLFGEAKSLMCMASQVSQLEVNVEDCATMLLAMDNGMQVDIHLDFVQRTASRTLKIVGELGTILWSMSGSSVQVDKPDSTNNIVYQAEVNQMYIDEVSAFMKAVDNQDTSAQSLKDSIQTLKVALASHQSNDEGIRISL